MSRTTLFVCGDLHNLGDLALLLQNLEVMGSGRRLVRRWSPLPAEIERQVAEAGGTLFDGRRPGTAAHARRADILIGGGQLVRDNVSLRSLANLLSLVAIARMTGGRVTCRGLGVSSLRSRSRRWLWRAILALAKTVCVRDFQSQKHVKRLCAPSKVVLTADMAFHKTSLHFRLRPEQNASRSLLAVAPCVDSSEGRSIEGPAFTSLLAAARPMLKPERTVYLCHDPRPDMDILAAQRLMAGDCQARGSEIEQGYGLDKLLGLYSRSLLVLTNRLHAAIFSILADRPILLIDDGSHKIASLAGAFSLPCVEADAALDAAAARQLIMDALNYDRIARRQIVRAASEAARLNLEPDLMT